MGKVWHEKKTNKCWFKLEGLENFLKREGFTDRDFDRVKITNIIKEYKGGYDRKSVAGKTRYLYWIPTPEENDERELPKQKKEAF